MEASDNVVVRVRSEGEKVFARSQAKRLVRGLERFQRVVFDFEGVAEVGQGFADEVFRVFAADHPGVTLTAANASSEVGRMIGRVLNERERAS